MATRVCVVGATGRFGRAILEELPASGLQIAGGVCSDRNPLAGRTLREAGLAPTDAPLLGSSHLPELLNRCDIVVFVSKPEADMVNIPLAVGAHRKIVLGTTGFNHEQRAELRRLLSKVPSVWSSNFSLGANIMAIFARILSRLQDQYDYSIVEHHHSGKADAPSGTALWLAGELAREATLVTDRTARPRRLKNEVEVYSLRGGSVPGTHILFASGQDELLRIEHTAFSRRAFARGCAQACKWLASKEEPGVYTMMDVLGLGVA